MAITSEQVIEALKYVIEPDLKKDIVSLGLVANIEVGEKEVSFLVKVSNPAMHSKKRMEEACEHQIHRFLGKDVKVNVHIEALPKSNEREPEQRKKLAGIKNIIAVASGKGGVGKSTVTANLAVGLAQRGFKTGIVDADIYGPSIPLMFDVVTEKPGVVDVNGKSLMEPVVSYGVKVLSIGFFAEANQAVAWRGPMASKALNQMLSDAHWGELDYLLIDLPPGTGDIHLSLVSAAPLTGAIIVSTPQDVALADARKGIGMFRMTSIDVPVLGMVENMSWFTPEELPENKYYIFGKDGAKNLAEEMKVPLLAQLPLVQSIREAGDAGRPAIMQNTTPQAKAMAAMVDSFLENVKQPEKVATN